VSDKLDGRCATCVNWHKDGSFTGTCRFNPPVAGGKSWPETHESEWCSKYHSSKGMFKWVYFQESKPDENDYILAERAIKTTIMESGTLIDRQTFRGFAKNLPDDGPDWERWQV